MKEAAQFDQAFKGLEKVVDAPISRLKQLRKFALETSALVPISARNLISLMSEAAQGGVPIKELEKFSLFTAKAAVAFDMGGAIIGERFAKLKNVYKLNQDGIEKLADATNHLSNNFAAKASEITNFTNRAAGASTILNTTAVEMSAIGAAMIASGIVPETAARGVNALAARVVKGGKKVTAAFKMIGTSREEFMAAVKKDGAGAFNDLFKSMSKSENGMRALIDLVGTDFADDFAKLLSNPKLLDQTLKSVADRSKFAGSVVLEAAKQASGAAKNWELFLNKVAALGISLGTTLLPRLLKTTDALGGIITKIGEFAAANPELASTLTNTVAGLLAFAVASRVASFAWAVTGKSLFVGISKSLPVLKKAGTLLAALPGPLKLIGLAALAAGAAYSFFNDDAERLSETMAKDPEGFKKWEERLFGVERAADGAADAIGRLNKADIAIRLNKAEGAFAAQKDETVAALRDAIETSFFDKSSDDFTPGAQKEFGPAIKAIADKIANGSFSAGDVKPLKQQIDAFFTSKGSKLSGLNQKISSEEAAAKRGDDFSRDRKRKLVKMLRERDVLQTEFDHDQTVMRLVKQQITAAAKLQDDIAKAKAQLEQQKTLDKREKTTRPGISSSAPLSTTGSTSSPRDTAGRAALKRQLEETGDAAGKKLGKAATVELDGMASKIGAQIGKAAAAEMKKVTVQVNTLGAGLAARTINRAKAGALHDGVD